MTDHEEFEKWWLTKFSAEFLDSDNCWSAWTGWQARGELDKALAETQEPVARINVNKRRLEFVTPMDWSNLSTVAYYPDIDLYTTPSREWQSLSGDEFVDIAKSIWGDNLGMGDGYGYTVAWASSYATIEPSSKMLLLLHAIDKALREKNNG